MTIKEQVIAYNNEVKDALTEIMSTLNQGQKKKLAKNPKIKALLDRYKIEGGD